MISNKSDKNTHDEINGMKQIFFVTDFFFPSHFKRKKFLVELIGFSIVSYSSWQRERNHSIWGKKQRFLDDLIPNTDIEKIT